MPSVSIEIDLDEIDNDDLLEEVQRRLESRYRKFSDEEKKKIRKAFSITEVEYSTLNDQLLADIFKSAKERFTITEIENRLK